MKICKVENCKNEYNLYKGCARGYCAKHYKQLYKYGKILKRTIYDKNEYIDKGDYYEICLYKFRLNFKEVARALIDKDDYKKVKDSKWSLDGMGYVKTGTGDIRIHQLILGKKEGFEIDHINHNKLDNRKSNLRFVTHSENIFNRNNTINGYYFIIKKNKWVTRVTKNGQCYHIGYFNNEIDAKEARKKAELKYYGFMRV